MISDFLRFFSILWVYEFFFNKKQGFFNLTFVIKYSNYLKFKYSIFCSFVNVLYQIFYDLPYFIFTIVFHSLIKYGIKQGHHTQSIFNQYMIIFQYNNTDQFQFYEENIIWIKIYNLSWWIFPGKNKNVLTEPCIV